MKTDEDTKLEMIGKYLELGGTMLAQHCQCGAPLFRYHGNVVCPICDSNGSNKSGIDNAETSYKNITNKNSTPSNQTLSSTTQQSESTSTPTPSLPTHSESAPPLPTHSESTPPAPISTQSMSHPPVSHPTFQTSVPSASGNISLETHEFISNTIINKVVQLCLDLQRETDLGRIKQQMEAIKSGTKALKNLKKIN